MALKCLHGYLPGAVVGEDDKILVVEREVSRGKLGSTFACVDVLGNPRLLQVIRPFNRRYETLRERWAEQAAELRRVRHPGLVELFDTLEHDGDFHLVHELCGDRLDRAIAAPEWDGRRWLEIVARAVLPTLEHLHRNGYCHWNLHPHNILCTTQINPGEPDEGLDRKLKVADFAANALLGRVEVLNTKVRRSLVPPEYLSPSECGPLDHRADVYQAGLLLLCVAAGRVVRYSLADIAAGLPAQQAGLLDSPGAEVLARALQPRVSDRFPSAAELWHALSDVQEPSMAPVESAEQIF